MAFRQKTRPERQPTTLPKTTYQAPVVIPLGELASGKGAPNCGGGSTATKCANGGLGPVWCGGGSGGAK